eukprot:Hpha_TRINITY_DN14124_c0_g3::TRINITY_DN14124_c0_g3_i1::g.10964::m.10964
MLQQRYRKQRELREQRRRQARINSFVRKRQKMHWGMYNASDESPDCGLQFDCLFTSCKVVMRKRYAEVEITTRYQVASREAEYYFPVSEVGNLKSIEIRWKQGGPGIELQRMDCQLYEQLEDGLTQPYEKPEPIFDDDDTASVKSEASSLLSYFRGDPAKKARDEAERKRRDDERRKMYYFFGTGPKLKEMTVGKDVTVQIKYVVATYTEKMKYDDTVLTNFMLPLTVFNSSPNRWDITVDMPENIRRIRPKLQHQRIWSDMNGRKATVHLQEGYKLPLEDEYLILQVELGDPIEPRCADPVALFIFATFIGLMVWFSLTKDLP